MKKFIFIVIIILAAYLLLPIQENFKNTNRSSNRSGYGRSGYGRSGYGYGRHRNGRNTRYGGYGYGGYGGYYGNDLLEVPIYYPSYNWFDFRNCPTGCVANSYSPTGFSCVPDSSGLSCLTDYDCGGCSVPLVY